MDKIRILQIGTESWENKYSYPDNVKIIFADNVIEKKKEIYEIVMLERNLEEDEVEAVLQMSMSYCVFIVGDFKLNRPTEE